MLLLSEIRAISLTRSWRREDGTYGNVYQVEIKSGDDVLLTETFLTQDGMDKRGIIPGAVGQARVMFDTNTFTNREGKRIKVQRIRLEHFEPMVSSQRTGNTMPEETKQQEHTQTIEQAEPQQEAPF